MSDPASERPRRIGDALEWIRGVLDGLGIPFQIAGGLAAIAHGSDRELHDIDIYVPRGALAEILPHVKGHRGRGPRRHRGARWDCLFTEVRYAGEEIELAEAERTRYRAGEGEPWFEAEVDFSRPALRTVFGVEVPVMPLEDLVRYKRRIGRPVDVEDLARIAADG